MLRIKLLRRGCDSKPSAVCFRDPCDGNSAVEGIAKLLGESIDERLIASPKAGQHRLDSRIGSLLCYCFHAADDAAGSFFGFIESRERGAQADLFGIASINAGHEWAHEKFQQFY